MKLDYSPAKRVFILHVPRGEAEPTVIMEEHGLDFSAPDSTPHEAILFTREPYAAVAFFQYATPAAQDALLRLQTGIKASWALQSDAHIDCPADQELWGFQKAGVEYAMQRTNTLFGDPPGLGKTAQAICLANEQRAKRVLVLCPASIRLQWVQMIRRWSTMPWPYTVYPILKGSHGVHPTAQWTVVSYDLARSPAIWKALAEGLYDLLVLDEGHYLKTIDSARTRSVFGGGDHPVAGAISDRSGSVVALTGTPLPNRPREAYTLSRGLCFDAIDWMSEDSFTTRFNPSKLITGERGDGTPYTYVDERSGRHGELQARLRYNFMVRRNKQDALPQLQLPLFDIVHIEETGAIRAALAAERMLDINPENLEGANAETLGHVATVRRMMGVAMAPGVADYIETILDGGEDKVVLFGHHTEVLNILQERLGKYGLVRIDGNTSAPQKLKRVQIFQRDQSVRICLGNTISMGTGTDGLQEVCRHAVLAEPDWTPGNNQQAVDRLDRGGQNNQVQADFLVARGSYSERVLASSLRKNQTTHKALDRIM